MAPELKEKLLLRKFTSIEYIEQLVKSHAVGLEGLIDCIDSYDKLLKDKTSEYFDFQVNVFKIKVIPNFKMNQRSFEQGLENANITPLMQQQEASTEDLKTWPVS